MGMAQHLADLESELAEWREEFTKLATKIRGREAEVAAVRGAVANRSQLADLPRTAAIVAVLQEADTTLTPSQILARLVAAGRDDDLRKVTATLDYLVKSGLVVRPSRGHYLPS